MFCGKTYWNYCVILSLESEGICLFQLDVLKITSKHVLFSYSLFRKTSFKAEQQAQCEALTPWPRTGERVELDQDPSWLQTQACERILAFRHRRDICWWGSETGPCSLKGFPRSEKWGSVCVCVCSGSPCATWAESWKEHLPSREYRWPGYTKSTNRALAKSALRWRLPQGEPSTSEGSFCHSDAPERERS